jgi:sulfur-oxidizing protein SoxY
MRHRDMATTLLQHLGVDERSGPNRRAFLLTASSAAAVLGLFGAASPVAAQDALALDAAIKKAIGDAKPADGRITLTLPEIAENGNTVPFEFAIDSPMTDADHVKAVHIFAPGNPQPDVASFLFSPASGKAAVSSRMRLGKTQDVVAIAQMSDGKVFIAKRTVKVTIGGCGG